MTLAHGTLFNFYQIGESIGIGGMGEVYRATDTKLKREVAIKVLPSDFATDTERLARFQREAEMLASLNHANIGQIYGIETANGITALVMELIEGPTLAERIVQGPIAPDEALNIAMQICAALEAAHDKGIVHRDLKPANIKLRPDGTVKVLDFGIAKAIDPHTSSGARSPVVTTPAMTEAGMIMGTAAYMSPEQARGRFVDQRTDIWAFGCVLYEMLTGQPAFGGEDVMMTLARVLDRDTDMNSIPATISPAVQHTIKLCLRKDPKKRVADIRDVRLALAGEFESVFTAPTHAASKTQALWQRVLLIAGGATLATVVLGLAGWSLWPSLSQTPTTRLSVTLPSGILFGAGNQNNLSVSPDGRYLALTGLGVGDDSQSRSAQLWLWPLDSLVATPVPGTSGAYRPFWSPDSRSIGFSVNNSQKRVDIFGSPPQTIVAGGSGTWSADNIILFQDAAGGLSSVAAGGGETTPVTAKTANDLHHELPVFLPDGRRFLYFRHASDLETSGIYAGSLDFAPDQQPAAPLLLADDGPRFVPGPADGSGYLLFLRQGTMFAQGFDPAALTLSGDALPIEAAVAGGNGDGLFTTSANGRLLIYQPKLGEGRSTLVWVDRDGNEEPLGIPDCFCGNFSLSPDGSHLALTLFERGTSESDIWVWSFEQRALTRVTFEPGRQAAPVWSPDSERIAYAAPDGIHARQANGTGTAGKLLDGINIIPKVWLTDDQMLYAENGNRNIGIFSISGEPAARLLLAESFSERLPALSPDGRWLAYSSDESGEFETYVRPYPDINSGKWQVSTGGGGQPGWSSDGSMLFFIGATSTMAAAVLDGPAFRHSTPEPVFDHGFYDNTSVGNYDVSPDGTRLIKIRSANATTGTRLSSVIMVEHWLDKLNERMQ